MAADLIRSNLSFYDKIKPRNHVNSSTYTVFASINNASTGELIALATGTQAGLKVYSNDIEDCHAESLVRRAFKRFLLDKLLSATNLSAAIEDLNSSRYIVFISQFPCGLVKKYQGDDNVQDRKPGRGQERDGKVVYVERSSCLNKLKRWISSTNGFQGGRLAEGVGLRTRLSKLLIGDCEPDSSVNQEKLTDKLGELLDSRNQGLACERVAMRREEFVFNSSQSKQAQAVSLIWWLADKSSGRSELVVDGRKMGLTKRQSESDKDIFKLKISDYWLRRDAAQVIARFKEDARVGSNLAADAFDLASHELD